MVTAKILFLGFGFLMINVFLAVVTSPWYTAFCIRYRNSFYYAVFGSKKALIRVDEADIIGERWSRWLRPIAMSLGNLGWIVFSVLYLLGRI